MKENFFKQLQKIETLAKSGNFDDAIQLLKKLIRKRPADSKLLLFLGKLYFFKGELENAENYLNKVIKIDPNSYEVNFILGNLNATASRHEKAINYYKNSLKLETNEHILNNIGASYMVMKDYDNAIYYFRKALDKNSSFHHGLFNLGQTIYLKNTSKYIFDLISNNKTLNFEDIESYKQIKEGIRSLELLVSLNPMSFEAHRYIALLQKELGDVKNSERHLEQAIKIKSARSDLKSLAYSLNYESEQLNKAGEVYDVLIQTSESDEEKYEFYTKKIGVYLSLNKKDEAFNIFKNYFDKFADQDLVRLYGSFIKKISNNEIDLIKNKIQDIIDNESDQQILSLGYFEKARISLHENEIDQYIQYLNESKKQRIEYIEKEKPYLISLYELDKIQLKNRIDFLKKIELEKLSIDFKPIFVMGMVRSGTTLNEMILSNHKDVTGCGEIGFLKEKLELFKYVFNNKILTTNDVKDHLTELRNQYINYVLSRKVGNKGYFVDKNPPNAEVIDVLKIMFPQAKFIYSKRDDMANAWSIYSNHFGNNIYWVNSMQGIVDRKRIVQEFVGNAEKELGIELLYQDYSELVESPEGNIKRLLDFCDLDFDENCLHPENNEKSIRTLSIDQARQPIFKGSDDKWKKFEKYLDVFKKEFLN